MADKKQFDIQVDAEVAESTDSSAVETTDTSSANMSDSSSTLYANAEKAHSERRQLYSKRGDSADEIDPRKLVRDPSLSELRWYYRRTFAKKLVNKPIDDAFKHGFAFDGDDAEYAEELLYKTDYECNYKLAEKKARRDGFALLFVGTRDTSEGVHVSPKDDDVTVTEITHTKVLTVDDLCWCAENEVLEQVQASYPELEHGQFKIRQTGIVINTDINSPDYRDPIGYILYQGPSDSGEKRVQFIHKDRVQHLVWNEEVDGDYRREDVRLGGRRWKDERPLGKWEGDSILVQSYDLMKGITKGNWAIMQALFRNAANLYAVHLPNDATQEEFNAARQEFKNLNAKSELFMPGGPPGSSEDTYQIEQYTSGDMVEPSEYFDVIFDQICASHEMTKSVLFGTQMGTVSGSEVDIKNYFNKVERYRQNRATMWIKDFVKRAKFLTDGRRKDDDQDVDLTIDWEPLFKLTDVERVNTMQSLISAMQIAINGFVLTPDEARSILDEEWAFIEITDLTEEQKEWLEQINAISSEEDELEEGRELGSNPEEEAENGSDPNEGESEEEGYENPSMRQGGGMPEGHKTSELAGRM